MPRRLVWALGGLLLVGILCSEGARRVWLIDHPPREAGSAGLQPASFYRLSWGELELLSPLEAGQKARVALTVRNIGNSIWPDRAMADSVRGSGGGSVRLSYRWWQADADVLVTDYTTRVDLLYPVPAGESITLSWELDAPQQSGRYRLQVDLVHELVTWFEGRGADRLLVPLTVGSA